MKIFKLLLLFLLPFSMTRASDIFHLVKDVSELYDGAEIVFVDVEHKAVMGKQLKRKQIESISLTTEISPTLILPSEATIFQIKKENNLYSFLSSDGYLTCPFKDDKRSLRISEKPLKDTPSKHETSFATITIDDNQIARVLFKVLKPQSPDRPLLLGRIGFFGCYFIEYDSNIKIYIKGENTITPTLYISSLQYATFFTSKSGIKLPKNANAYTLHYHQNHLFKGIEYPEGSILPANEPVIIHAPEGTYKLQIATTETKPDIENILQGTDEDTEIIAHDNESYYKLSLNSEEEPESLGFYWDSPNGRILKNMGHKAYLKINNPNKLSSFFLLRNISTGILKIQDTVKEVKNNLYFNLEGKQVSNPQHGVFIYNGKKIYIK